MTDLAARPIFKANHALAGRENAYPVITVDVAAVLRSWRESLFSFEWLDPDGRIRKLDDLPIHERDKRIAVERAVQAGQPLDRPVLGIGLLDNVEIGAGRDIFLTLAALGQKTLDVHVPAASRRDFESFLSRSREGGSVFFLILLGIALFAGLSYAVFNGSRTSTASLSADQARLAAQEIVAYGNAIQKAVQTLRLRGCSVAELSFEDSANNSRQKNGSGFTYTNSNAPTDGSCHVFGAGGRVTSQLLSSGYIDPSSVPAATSMDSRSFTITMARMQGAGSENADASGTDLILHVGWLRPEVCMAVNKLLNVANPGSPAAPPVDAFNNGSPYAGTMSGTGSDALADQTATIGKTAFCSGTDSSGQTYSFHQLVLAR